MGDPKAHELIGGLWEAISLFCNFLRYIDPSQISSRAHLQLEKVLWLKKQRFHCEVRTVWFPYIYCNLVHGLMIMCKLLNYFCVLTKQRISL